MIHRKVFPPVKFLIFNKIIVIHQCTLKQFKKSEKTLEFYTLLKCLHLTKVRYLLVLSCRRIKGRLLLSN